jgi:peptidoglycan-associated lipoprotein
LEINMHRSYVVAAIILSILIGSGGCARKSSRSALDPTGYSVPVTAVQPSAEEATDSMQRETDGDVRTATLNTLDGKSLEKVYFDYDSYTLKPEARRALDVNAGWMRDNPEAIVTIAGHCDERGSDEYNLALGDRRAKAVKSYLAALGIAPERLGTISYGEEMPASDGRDEAAWSKNRRAEFR